MSEGVGHIGRRRVGLSDTVNGVFADVAPFDTGDVEVIAEGINRKAEDLGGVYLGFFGLIKGDKLRQDGLDLSGAVIADRRNKLNLLMVTGVKPVDGREFAHMGNGGLGFGLFGLGLGNEFIDEGDAFADPAHNRDGHRIAASFVPRAVGAFRGGFTFPGDSGIPLGEPLEGLAFLRR
jgi:hypothetical protein